MKCNHPPPYQRSNPWACRDSTRPPFLPKPKKQRPASPERVAHPRCREASKSQEPSPKIEARETRQHPERRLAVTNYVIDNTPPSRVTKPMQSGKVYFAICRKTVRPGG